ncbi:MAG: hypothetical protein RL139_258 [Gemmatimonadota bacterium]|jgi:hypothetical protein
METPRGLETPSTGARWGLFALTLAAALLRLHGLAAEEPWFDEVFSIVASSQDLPTLWRSALADQTNPPGFYLLLWGWIHLGGFDLAWMRLLPALASIVAVPAVGLATFRLGRGAGPALVAAALAAVSPLMLAMAHELRTYAMLALVTTLTLAAVVRGHRVATAAGYLALVALHYFGAFVVAALALGEILRDPRRWRAAVATALPSALLLGGWLALVAQSAVGRVGGNAAWIPPFQPHDLVTLAAQVVGTFGTAPGAALVSAALLAALGIGLVAARRDPPLRPVVTLAVLPLLLVGVTATLLDRPLWVARYLIIVLPAWWMLLAIALGRWSGRAGRVGTLAMLAWATLAGLHAERVRPRKTAWSAVARALTTAGPRTLCATEFYVTLPLRYQALEHGIPLTLLDLDACTAARRPDGVLLRPGTETMLRVLAARGATIGPATDLHTMFPETRLAPIAWPATSP